jgi:hypothetical protein
MFSILDFSANQPIFRRITLQNNRALITTMLWIFIFLFFFYFNLKETIPSQYVIVCILRSASISYWVIYYWRSYQMYCVIIQTEVPKTQSFGVERIGLHIFRWKCFNIFSYFQLGNEPEPDKNIIFIRCCVQELNF